MLWMGSLGSLCAGPALAVSLEIPPSPQVWVVVAGCGAEGDSSFVLLFSQDLSYNQLTECPRELENAKNMLVLNLGHNR